MRIQVKVTPRSSRDEVVGWLQDAWKLRVRAAPEHGRANEAVERLLAASLKIPRSAVRVVIGPTSSKKVVEIDGLETSQVAARLAEVAQHPA